jgi:hypothetical protein
MGCATLIYWADEIREKIFNNYALESTDEVTPQA